MTPPHSPLPWRSMPWRSYVDNSSGIIIIASDGVTVARCKAEDAALIVAAVNSHAKMRVALAFYADSISWQTKSHPQIDAFDTPAINDKGALARAALPGAAAALEQQAREIAELRERTIEEIAQFLLAEPIHSWVPSILAKRIRALTKSSK
jgi:hypothetical protein